MKKITSFLGIMLIALCMMFSSCGCFNHNDNNNDTPVETVGYNYDEVVRADYDYIASQYGDTVFHFYEVDVLYKDLLSVDGEPEIESIKTVFQCGDTCIMILHSHGENDTVYVNDWYMECMDMSAYNVVTYDSCMNIIKPYRPHLNTKALTFRRVLAPPFPENGQYIFGTGILVVDSNDGHVEQWDNIDETAETVEPQVIEVDNVVLE